MARKGCCPGIFLTPYKFIFMLPDFHNRIWNYVFVIGWTLLVAGVHCYVTSFTGLVPTYYINSTGIADSISGFGSMYKYMIVSTLYVPVSNYATQTVGILKIQQLSKPHKFFLYTLTCICYEALFVFWITHSIDTNNTALIVANVIQCVVIILTSTLPLTVIGCSIGQFLLLKERLENALSDPVTVTVICEEVLKFYRSMQKGFGPLLLLVCVGNSFGMLFKLYLIIIVGNYSDLLTLFTSYLFVVYFCYVSEDAYCGLKEMIIIARETKMSGVVCDQLDNVLYSMEQAGPLSGMGMFQVRISTLASIISNVVTYLIALLQFPKSID